jgi:AhpD family alkylhydroperoxidase
MKVAVEDWDPELRAMVRADAMPDVTRSMLDILAHSPQIAKAFVQLFGTFKKETALPARLVELVRLRLAFHNQCRTCMSIRYTDGVRDGVTEDLVCSLERPMEASDLTEAERQALVYADRFMTDHLSINDSQVVELNVWLAMSGFGRAAAVFHMVEALPEYFQDEDAEKIVPWNAPHIVVD